MARKPQSSPHIYDMGKKMNFYNRSYVARGGEFWEERNKKYTLPILARRAL